MKIFKAILKIIGLLLLVLALAFFALDIYSSIDKQDTFYLRNAQFSDFDYLSNFYKKLENKDEIEVPRERMNIYVHRLSKGKGLILAYRWYTNGDTMIVDDESFKKITIWLAKSPASFPVKYDFSSKQNIKGAYTSGGSAWPRSACSGYIESGTMTLTESGSSYAVKIKATVYPAGSSLFRDYCKEQKIDYEFSASELEFSDLTPWLGLKGEHPYAETYR
ncbi:MAG: hypothetical protein P8171_07045 [Candidatus Thiodiazotropha sp.]